MDDKLNSFIELIQHQFNEEERDLINENTDIKSLKGWSSLQTMIVVNEIDKNYGVVLDNNDFKLAENVKQLFLLVNAKQN